MSAEGRHSRDNDVPGPEAGEVNARWGRDPQSVEDFVGVVGPFVRTYFRLDVRGMGNVPEGPALVVSNHSGGALTVDLPVFLTGFVDHFGFDRPMFLLSHEFLFQGSVGRVLRSWGLLPASRDNASQLLRDGAVTLVFPGGEYDASRPFYRANRIDFGGRIGYVRTALEAGVPIVPCVSIGGQETQLFLGRAEQLVKRLGMPGLRARSLPVSFGIPFGFSAILPLNLPLPAKITTSVLPPVDLAAFGNGPDPRQVDEHVRAVMQAELDSLASERRFPVIG